MDYKYCKDGTHERIKKNEATFRAMARDVEQWPDLPMLEGKCPNCPASLTIQLEQK